MTDSTKPAVRSNRVRWWAGAVAAAVAVAVTLVACMPTGWTGDGYTFSRGQMQDALAHKFPFQRRFLGFFDVTLSNPQVSLDPRAIASPSRQMPWWKAACSASR